jgi:holo-[acyl-carrier protein] synthase
MAARAGIDLVAVEDVRDSLRRHGTRWMERVFAPGEIADCRRGDGVDARALAERFAAKEATLKLLAVAGDEAVPWRSIEVRAGALELSGAAAGLAASAGFERIGLSTSQAGDYAVAVVLVSLRSA